MKVGLFIPCYVDQFYPNVGKATLELLEKLGCDVEYPLDQTCCGQPLANSGMEQDAKTIYDHFVSTFADLDHIVAPSASCVYHVKHHYDILSQTAAVKKVRANTIDICHFLSSVLEIKDLSATYPHKVGVHQSCHGLRGLRMAKSTEIVGSEHSEWITLLQMVSGIEIIDLDRCDECCGFGGTFSVTQEAVSVKMGKDRIRDHKKNGAEFITSGDMSCPMHLDGLLRRTYSRIKVKHIVEILNADSTSSPRCGNN